MAENQSESRILEIGRPGSGARNLGVTLILLGTLSLIVETGKRQGTTRAVSVPFRRIAIRCVPGLVFLFLLVLTCIIGSVSAQGRVMVQEITGYLKKKMTLCTGYRDSQGGICSNL